MIPRFYRKQVHSAMYFLVWGCGLSIEKAEEVLDASPRAVKPLAEQGSKHWQKCERALLRVIGKIEREKNARLRRHHDIHGGPDA